MELRNRHSNDSVTSPTKEAGSASVGAGNPRRVRLAWLLGAVVAVRVLLALLIYWRSGVPGFFEGDSFQYMNLAESLLRGSFGQPPEILRTPAYPLLLAIAVAMKQAVVIGVLENIALAAGCACLVWRIALDFIGDERVAACAAILYCLEPIGLFYSAQLLSETLFCFCFLFFVQFLLAYFRSPGFSRLFKAALLLALATYVRPVSVYLALWLVPVLLMFPKALPRARRVGLALAFPVLVVLMLTPWMVRNQRAAGYAGFSSSGDFNIYYNSAVAVQARTEHKGFLQVRDELGYRNYYALHPEQQGWTQGQVVAFWGSEARRILSQHVLTYILIHARGCAVVLFDTAVTPIASALGLYPRAGGFMLARTLDKGMAGALLWLIRTYPLTATLFLLLELPLLLVYVLGFAGLRKLSREMQFLFVASTVYFVLVSGMPGATGRFRAPFMPLLCLCAARALVWFYSRKAGSPGHVEQKTMLFPA